MCDWGVRNDSYIHQLWATADVVFFVGIHLADLLVQFCPVPGVASRRFPLCAVASADSVSVHMTCCVIGLYDRLLPRGAHGGGADECSRNSAPVLFADMASGYYLIGAMQHAAKLLRDTAASRQLTEQYWQALAPDARRNGPLRLLSYLASTGPVPAATADSQPSGQE